MLGFNSSEKLQSLILSPSSSFPFENADGRRNMVKLAQRLVDNFCAGMHESSSCKWIRFVGNANVIKDLMVMSKYNANAVGEPAGIVVSAATSVLLQVSPQRLFDLLKDMSSRSKWDILCNEQPVKEIIHLGKGQDQGNAISHLHKRWADMFPSMFARVTTIDVISGGTVGTRDGALHLMNADHQILSPLVPTREVSFFRYSKQLEEGVWAIVDVSINGEFQSNIKCRRFPSGVLVQDMPDGYSKVTWVEHTEYDESEVHELFRPMLRSGMGLGSQCWVSILQRSCKGLILSPSSSFPFENADGRRNMVKLAQRLVDSFCAGMHESSSCKWTRFVGNANVIKDLMVMSKKNANVVGEPAGIVVSAATSILLQVLPQRLFDLLRDMSSRSKWDILCNEQPVKEIIHLGKGQDQGNAISLLHALGGNKGNGMIIIQETCTDASGSIVVYAPVDGPSMRRVLNGGDSSHVAVLPFGFAIQPDGTSHQNNLGGSLLTVSFQLLGSSLATETPNLKSVAEKMNNLILHTIFSIKRMLGISCPE